jgi:ATP-binding cassette subfamily F protein 3
VLLVSHDRALLDAVAERTLAIEGESLQSYDGGWADYVRVREDRRAADAEPRRPERSRQPKPRPAPPAKPRAARPSELQRVEAAIADRERVVAELEQRLADDWSDVATLTEHRRARDELQSLLERWETLFERAQS